MCINSCSELNRNYLGFAGGKYSNVTILKGGGKIKRKLNQLKKERNNRKYL